MALTLDSDALLTGLGQGLERAAGRKRRTLVSMTAPVEGLDPSAVAFASRLASDRWFCWEQPDREFAIGAVGSAHEAVSRGPDRFRDVDRECLRLAGEAIVSGAERTPAGAGPLWCGGFAFADEGGRAPAWSSFAPASMTMPELSICRRGEGLYLTLNAVLAPAEDPAVVLSRAGRRLAALRDEPLPMLGPQRSGPPDIRSTRSPGEFERAVSEAVARIEAGGIAKVVLAREVVVTAGSAYDPAPVFGALRELFPSCFCFCCGTAEGAFLGASPELLLRRAGASLSTVALAGSTRRSSDPSVDDHLGEQLLRSEKDRREHEIVARRIIKALRRHAVWVEGAAEPSTVKVANIQHLATPIVAQLAEPRSAIEMAGALHPTPAVGGDPWPRAAEEIDDLEHLDRGWYAGPIGWMDASEDGEFCVAVRSALLRDRTAHLFAGGGIVAGSDPAAELAETEVKLEALLPLLS